MMSRALCFEVLSDGGLLLTLDGACIESTARRAHRELTMALLAGRADERAMGAAVDLLARFLGTTDFAALRTQQPKLFGNQRCRVRLLSREGDVRWELKK